MTYPLHKNDTGSFQELAHASEGIEFGQLSLLTIAPGCTRGGHYHTRKKEWFCCINGKCRVTTTDVHTGYQMHIVLDENKKHFIAVGPYEAHSILNFDESKECTLLIICNEEYDPDNADTLINRGSFAKYIEVGDKND